MLLLALLAATGCGEISGNHPDVVAARLFAEDGTELTPVVPVPDGDVVVVEARFYDASGNELNLQFPEHAMGIRSFPGALLNVAPVADEPFRRELTIGTPCVGDPSSLAVGYGHWGRGDEREFGPFEVQPIGEVGSMELFGPDGEQLTPDVQLPFEQQLRVEVRVFGCDGEEITDLPGKRSILIFWSDDELLEMVPVEGQRFVYDVTAVQPVGTKGQMSFAYGTTERPGVRVVGPFSVEVVETPLPEPPEEPVVQPERR